MQKYNNSFGKIFIFPDSKSVLMKIFIRDGQKADIPKIVEFQIAMAKETESLDLDKITVKKGVRAVFEDSSKGWYFVATMDDKLIASTLLTPEWSDWRNGVVYWMQSVYVLPEYRGKKVFSKMYDHIQKIAMKDGKIMGLRLYVDKTNHKAQKVYEKLGMDGSHYKLFEWMK